MRLCDLRKITILMSVAFSTSLLLALPVHSSSPEAIILGTNGGIQYNAPTPAFEIRGTTIGLDHFYSGTYNVPNIWSMLEDLNINHIRVGGFWGTQRFRITSVSNWAQNLDNFLAQASSHGITVSFIAMGYIDVLGPINYGSMSLSDAQILIDKLAGNTQTTSFGGRTFYGNTLGHNFITDPRVYVWTTSNEQSLTSGSAALQWNLDLCDYIRSKGGRTEIAYARVLGDWDHHPTETGNLLYGHVDQVHYHEYGEYAYVTYFQKSLTSTWNGMTYYQWYVSQFQQMLSTPHFTADQIVLGEYGCWIGTGSNEGLSGVTFTNQDRINIYSTVYAAAQATGFKNFIFHYIITYPGETPDYGIYAPDGSMHDQNLANIVREAYSS